MRKLYLVAVAILAINAAQEGHATMQNDDGGNSRDYGGGIYSTQGSRDNYTTAPQRQGTYTTKDTGSIYDSSDKREGIYTTNESKSNSNTTSGIDVTGSKLKDY